MMGTTHALIGLLLGSTAILWQPEMLVTAGLASFIGGLFPDLDMPFQHRKTLHFPAYYTAVLIPLSILAFTYPQPVSLAFLYFFLGAAAHCWTDILGGGLEERPWEMTSDRAVYLHIRKKWIRPRFWIRYDGAPEDFILGFVTGILCFLIYNNEIILYLIYGSIAASLVYTLIRKKILDWAPEFLLKTF